MSASKTYSRRHPITVGAKCMVMVDQKTPAYCGGRWVVGIIRDKFNGIVTVEITDSSFDEYRKYDQIFFSDFQIWPLGQEVEQLKLF